MQGEAESTDVEATASYSEDLAKIINEGRDTKWQIFIIDEISLMLKEDALPSKTFIAREEKLVLGFKTSKDRLTLLLVANAAHDLTMKPVLIYHSQNSGALKNYANFALPELYKWNNKVWMTAHLLTTWFTKYFKLVVETYCSEKSFLWKKYYGSLTMHLVM